MQILELFRPATASSPTEAADGEPSVDAPWRAPLIGGASAASVSLLTVMVIVGIVGSLAARASSDWATIFGTGSAMWLMFGGARLAADGVFVAVTPLLGTAGLVWVALRSARRSLPDDGSRRIPYAAWLAGYGGVALAAVALASAGPAIPVWWSVPLPVLGVPALALGMAEVPRGRWEWLAHRVPRVLRRAVRPAVRTCIVLMATGMTLTLLAVAVRLGEVGRLYAELQPGFLGALALTGAQVLVWPNLGLWSISVLTGPGVTVTEGAQVTLGGADAGLLPLIPVFGALPGPVDFGWYVSLLVLIPVLIGGYAARRALLEIPRLASSRTKLASVAATIALTAVLVAGLDGLAGGSLGDGRLATVGPSAVSLFASLCLTLGVGAFAVLVRDWWRLRR
ncbi:DUF6350 family protein [Nostocoides sp.]|uniref:cell division protein PerM n=1 Tax=Nostocoides sp. TaxID=1917966 RepID=UPI003BB074F5